MSKRIKLIVIAILVIAVCYLGACIVLHSNSHHTTINSKNESVITTETVSIDSTKKVESISEAAGLTILLKAGHSVSRTRLILRSIFAILCKIAVIPNSILFLLLLIVHSSCTGSVSILNYIHKSDGKKKAMCITS